MKDDSTLYCTVRWSFKCDPTEQGVSVKRAFNIIALLQQDPAVQELVMAVAAFHLQQKDIPLRPFLIEQSPGYSLSANRKIRFVANTLCISVIAAPNMTKKRGCKIAKGAVSIGRVVRDVLFPSSTKFLVWHCGNSLDIGAFVVRQTSMLRYVMDTDDNLKQALRTQNSCKEF